MSSETGGEVERHPAGPPGPSALPRFLVLYAAMFASWGVASPFFPGLLQQDGLLPEALATVLAAGTAIRLLAGPLAAGLADRWRQAPAVLAALAGTAAVVGLAYLPARGLPILLLVAVCHSALLAPLTPIADALALGSARGPAGFEYGWVRGAGSAAFIAGTLVSGQFVDWDGLTTIVWQGAALLAITASVAWMVPNRVTGVRDLPASATSRNAFATLLRIPVFVRLMIVAALIGGSHAMHDSFEVIRWRSAGMTAAESSVLWSLSVAAEVVVFLLVGRRLLTRLGPGRAIALSAVAGTVRWCAAALTASFPVMAIVEPLHGLTFALLHLACMDTIARSVPLKLAATGQAFYATIALGATTCAMTLASGSLYAHWGAGAFWPMALMCALAAPLAFGIRPATSETTELEGAAADTAHA